jgi:hypothetical protein
MKALLEINDIPNDIVKKCTIFSNEIIANINEINAQP